MLVYYQYCMDFSEWLLQELERRGWTRPEAARRAGVSASMFDKVINRFSRPGLIFYKGVARAFNMTLPEVLRIAGEYNESPSLEEWKSIYQQLSPDDQLEMLEIARLKLKKKKRTAGHNNALI